MRRAVRARCRRAVAAGSVGLVVAASPAGAQGAVGSLDAARPIVSGRAATLIEASTGRTLYGFDSAAPLPIASTTKIMTALVTLEHTRLSERFAAPDYAPSPAEVVIGLTPGERMRVHDLLLAMLLPSANDAAHDLAYNVGDASVGRFVGMMNATARRLGLRHTHYATPIGLDTPGNYSTASDLVRLAAFVRSHYPFFASAVAMRSAVLHSGSHVRVVINRNALVGRLPWVNGVKTGHTLDAGYVLVGSGTRRGMTLLSAVLGGSSESGAAQNTLALLNYGFAQFRLTTPVHAGAVIGHVAVRDQSGKRVAVTAAQTVHRVIGRHAKLTLRMKLPRDVSPPLRRHAPVGQLVVLSGAHVLARVPLLLARALPAPSGPAAASRFITRPSTVVSVLVLFGAAMALALRRWLRTRHARGEEAEPA